MVTDMSVTDMLPTDTTFQTFVPRTHSGGEADTENRCKNSKLHAVITKNSTSATCAESIGIITDFPSLLLNILLTLGKTVSDAKKKHGCNLAI